MNQYEWNLDEEYLAHHGILGMKWGIRRYQNEDGTLTALGRKRIYGAGAEGGYESYSNRFRRGVRTAQYNRDIEKTEKKLGKAREKGDAEKAYGLDEKLKKLKINRDIYMKDLSKEDIELGEKTLQSQSAQFWGTLIAGPVGGAIAYTAMTTANKSWETADKVNEQEKKRREAYLNRTQEEADSNARKAAQSAGLDQGDNWKMYRDAQAGDKRAQEVVKQWESENKSSSTEKKGMSSKTINDRVSYAMKTGKFDMEFLEQNGDLDQRSGELLQGKQLEDAYKKWLKEQG